MKEKLKTKINGAMNFIAKNQRKLVRMTAPVLAMLMTMSPAYASSGIESGIKTGLRSIWEILTNISVPIAVICAALCGIAIIVGNTKDGDQAKKTLIQIAIGLAVVFLAPQLIKTVVEWFSSQGDQGIFD